MGEDQARRGTTGEQPPTQATSGRTAGQATSGRTAGQATSGRTAGGVAASDDRAGPGGGALGGLDAAAGLAALRGLLARPLASYYLLIASAGLLLVIGLTMVFSATSVKAYEESGNAFAMLSKQAAFAFVGLVAFWACQRLPIRTFRAVGGPVLIVSLVLLLILDLVLAWGWLNDMRVARLGPLKADLNWLFLGPLQVQPSELAKFGLVLWGADVVARKGAALARWRELVMPIFPAVGLLFLLVGYNDLGTMLCLLAIVVGLFWAAGVRLRIFATLSAIGLVGVALLIAAASIGAGSGTEGAKNYRLLRLTVFINPPKNCEQDLCYQLIQARNAIDHGGWFGVGLGKSTFKWDWLPAAQNDFIFGVLAEELGVVGCVVVLVLFAVLAYTGLRIARRVDGPFRRLAAAAVTTWLITQAVINIGGVVGLLPITGLPLPFISDGGSALLVTLAAVGMLASLARAEPDAARALNARPPARWVRLLWAPLPPLPAASGRSGRPAPGARDAEAPGGRRSDANARPSGGRATGVRAGTASERRR